MSVLNSELELNNSIIYPDQLHFYLAKICIAIAIHYYNFLGT
uniref:Uncharacterized protein n=1 Tax=Anguilla anguilla TaxID=7936 RepID=A0A0E9W522_ANGAN